MIAQLFIPTPVEVLNVANSAKRRHPELAGRISKAADLLVTNSLQLDPVAWQRGQYVRWRVASQSGRGSYVISSGYCPCEDARRHGANCKHAIAAHLYMKVLCNAFNRSIKARQIDLGILPDRTFNAYAPKLGIVAAHKFGPAYVLADDASAVRYSIWLAAQASVNWTTPAATIALAA